MLRPPGGGRDAWDLATVISQRKGRQVVISLSMFVAPLLTLSPLLQRNLTELATPFRLALMRV